MQKKVLAVRLNAIFDCNIVFVGISWCTSDCTLMAALAFGHISFRCEIPSRWKPTSARLKINIRTVRVASTLITNINLDLEFRAFGFVSLDYVFFAITFIAVKFFVVIVVLFGGSLPIKGFFCLFVAVAHRRSVALAFLYDLCHNYVEP